jgi:DNA-binding beta-propeller fold protein YncE
MAAQTPALLGIAVGILAIATGCTTTGETDEGSLFYPSPPQRPRVQYLTKFANADDLEGAPSLLMRFLVGDTTSHRKLRKPTGVASHDGVIYVADPGWETLLILDMNTRSFGALGARGPGQLKVPIAVAVDGTGNKFVADTGRKQVVQFNAKNEFVRAFGNPDKVRPTGVAVDERNLYFSDRDGHRVVVMDRRTKATIATIGEFGSREGQFNIPTSLALDSDGHLYVTDGGNFRIQEFDSDGDFVKSYGLQGDGPGTFARPRGIGVDRGGHLYAVDAAFENVQIWDTSNAQVLMAFAGPGVGEGDAYLPASVFAAYDLNEFFRDLVDPEFELQYVILVANNYGPNKLAVYGFVSPRDPSAYPEFPLPEDDEE